MFRIEFPEPIPAKDLAESLGRALSVSRERKIKGRQPSVQYRPDRPGITKESEVWYLLKCGQRFIDVLCGVLAGEGYLVKVDEMPNPWEDKEPALPEDRLPDCGDRI